MEIWLDTTNHEAVEKAARLGILTGVTTNPSLIAKDPRPINIIIENLLDILDNQEGPVAVQVVADDAATMIEQGERLHDISDRIIVKVPVTKAGLEAIHILSGDYVPTMATVVFNAKQALMAAMAGADYVAPYVGRIEKSGQDPWKVLTEITTIYKNYDISTKIIAASLGSVEQVMKCAELHVPAVTIRESIFNDLIEDDNLTLDSLAQFDAEWKKQSKSLSVL